MQCNGMGYACVNEDDTRYSTRHLRPRFPILILIISLNASLDHLFPKLHLVARRNIWQFEGLLKFDFLGNDSTINMLYYEKQSKPQDEERLNLTYLMLQDKAAHSSTGNNRSWRRDFGLFFHAPHLPNLASSYFDIVALKTATKMIATFILCQSILKFKMQLFTWIDRRG